MPVGRSRNGRGQEVVVLRPRQGDPGNAQAGPPNSGTVNVNLAWSLDHRKLNEPRPPAWKRGHDRNLITAEVTRFVIEVHAPKATPEWAGREEVVLNRGACGFRPGSSRQRSQAVTCHISGAVNREPGMELG